MGLISQINYFITHFILFQTLIKKLINICINVKLSFTFNSRSCFGQSKYAALIYKTWSLGDKVYGLCDLQEGNEINLWSEKI